MFGAHRHHYRAAAAAVYVAVAATVTSVVTVSHKVTDFDTVFVADFDNDFITDTVTVAVSASTTVTIAAIGIATDTVTVSTPFLRGDCSGGGSGVARRFWGDEPFQHGELGGLRSEEVVTSRAD